MSELNSTQIETIKRCVLADIARRNAERNKQLNVINRTQGLTDSKDDIAAAFITKDAFESEIQSLESVVKFCDECMAVLKKFRFKVDLITEHPDGKNE